MTSRSYVSPRRKEAATATRARVIVAATELLRNEEGATAMSLESAAKAAGVTRATVYNQFGSRRGLLEAVFDARAREGGLFRIANAMALADPRAAMHRVIAIFCDFWISDPAIGRLNATAARDAEFEQAIAERNERRRRVMNGLVARLHRAGLVRAGARKDLVDLLFVFTSWSMFDQLHRGERAPKAVRQLIRAASDAALTAAAPRKPSASKVAPRARKKRSSPRK
jgi:AcrR family transcriptional regulator